MKIESSSIGMETTRVYTQSTKVTQSTTRTQLGTGIRQYRENSFLASYEEQQNTKAQNPAGQYDTFTRQESTETTPLISDLYSGLTSNNVIIDQAKTSWQKFHEELIRKMEEFMERIKEQLLGRGVYQSDVLDLTTVSGQPGSLWTRQDYQSVEYFESETTTFQTTGSVITADGRQIDFNMSMEMSRSFYQKSEVLQESTEYILTDPLVIKLDDCPDTIEPQTWLFDLDCDGTKEEISSLAKGNGFLALDLNGNGTIDDGSELFGTKSGNGFQDLAAYDEDGNGWIDENDAIYSKLKIWTKNSNGKDQLMNLSQADIGAIYLGAAHTQFAHKDIEENQLQAMVRQTGFYLHESTGTAGVIQQIDFATKKGEDVA